MKKYIAWVVVILWCATIFYLSHQPASISNDQSMRVTEKIVEIVDKVASQGGFEVKELNSVVRKNAHFFTYFVLGIVVLSLLRISKVRGVRSLVLGLLICVLIAISDEIHQMFVPGRGAEVKDVLIDSAGASAGILLYLLIGRLMRK